MANQGNETTSSIVEGMGCGGCGIGIVTIHRGTRGVRQAEVHFTTRLASISCDPALTASHDVAEFVRGEGYTVTPAAP